MSGVVILHGDALARLRQLPDQSVHMVFTSPPYWGLRDYDHPLQIGLEDTPQAFLDRLVAVFAEIWRVLRDDGTCWVNMGDSYAGSGGQPTPQQGEMFADRARGQQLICRSKKMPRGSGRWGRIDATAMPFRNGRGEPQAAPPKNTAPSARPPAVRAIKRKNLLGMPWRLAFALQEWGWILREDIVWAKKAPMPESAYDRCTRAHEYLFKFSKVAHDPQLWRAYDTREWSSAPDFSETCPHRYRVDTLGRPVIVHRWRGFDYYWDQDAIAEPASENTHPRVPKVAGWAEGGTKHSAVAHARGERRKPGVSPKSAPARSGVKANESFHAATSLEVRKTRNKRSVWTVASEPSPVAHFATFPTKLVEPALLAACPKGGTVLDPFGGVGTVGEVAMRHGRNAILIDTNPEYCRLARERIVKGMPLLAEFVRLEAA